MTSPDLTQDLIDTYQHYVDAFVDKTSDPRGCWVWGGSGRPTFSWKGVAYPVTHISLLIAGRPVPPGLFALHSCDNQMCGNADHLRPGTHAENMKDMVSRKRHHPEARAIGRRATHALREIGYTSVDEAAKASVFVAAPLHRAIRSGLIPAATVLGRRFVRRSDVATWLESVGGLKALQEAAAAAKLRMNRCTECGAPAGTWPEGCAVCRAVVDGSKAIEDVKGA